MNNEGRHLIRIGFGPALRDGRIKSEHMEMILDQMPDDTSILGFDRDYSRDMMYMVLEHADFPLTPSNMICPEVTAIIKQEKPEDFCEVTLEMNGKPWNPCEKEDGRRWDEEVLSGHGSPNTQIRRWSSVLPRAFDTETSGLKPNFLHQAMGGELMTYDYAELEARLLAAGIATAKIEQFQDNIAIEVEKENADEADKIFKLFLAGSAKWKSIRGGRMSFQGGPQNLPRDCQCKYEGWKFHTKDCPAKKTGPS